MEHPVSILAYEISAPHYTAKGDLNWEVWTFDLPHSFKHDRKSCVTYCPPSRPVCERRRDSLLQITALPILARVPGTIHLIAEVCFAGVQNITALGNLITWQKVEYDFDFHKQDFPCNILALVLSEGKSILKVTLNGFLAQIELWCFVKFIDVLNRVVFPNCVDS